MTSVARTALVVEVQVVKMGESYACQYWTKSDRFNLEVA